MLQAKKDRHADILAQSSRAKRDIEKELLAQVQETKRLERGLAEARNDLDREKNVRERLCDQVCELKKAAESPSEANAAAANAAEAARVWTARLAEKETHVSQLQGELTRLQAELQGTEARLKRSREEHKVANRRAEEGERLLAVYHKENMKVRGYDPIAASAPPAIHAVLNPTLRRGGMPSSRISADNHSAVHSAIQAMRITASPRSAPSMRQQGTRTSSARPRSIPWSTTPAADITAIDSSDARSRPWSAVAGSSRPIEIVSDASRGRASARPQSAALVRARESL